MKSTSVVIMILVIIASSLVLIQSDGVEADDNPAMYCYTYDLTFFYEGGTMDLDSVEWTVTDQDGNAVPFDRLDAYPWTIHIVSDDVAGCDYLDVTQTAIKGSVTASETQRIIPLINLGHDDRINVTFIDRQSTIVSYEIGYNKVVIEGTEFVSVPESPVRDGYDFQGWFLSDGTEFDPKRPITEDTNVYARWVSTGGGSSGSIQVDNHVVTFQCDTGLTYNLLSNTGGVITFEVLEESGYDVVWSTVEVTADYCDVSYINGVYTLSGINSDVIVQITGEVVTSDNPNAPSDDGGTDYTLYAILLIILAIICIALAVYIMRTRGSRV